MSTLRGRFAGELDELMQAFASSTTMDLEIADEDIRGSRAHAAMLGRVGVLSADDAAAIDGGLARIGQELAAGTWRPGDEHEDLHMAVEARLVELIGEPGLRLHTARSRNDQVATAVRLWLRRRLDDLDRSLAELVATLLDRVEADGRTLIPGYTHLQRAQPVLLGHHLVAHAWALTRDRDRVAGARHRCNLSPLGACALAGTSHPIDRDDTASALGFAGIVDNAMDAVAARDHLQEAAATCAITMGTLSRMAAELILWSSAEHRLVRLADHLSTGSSIMPQKRNPDAAELVRGKAGRVFANLQALLTLVKGLPLAYNRDLQEDRAPVTDALNQTIACVRIMAAMWGTLEVDRSRFDSELDGDFILATELADCLVERGVAFRDAHAAVGRAVSWCEAQGGNLTLLDGGRAAQFHSAFPEDLGPWLDPRAAAERRTSRGGTAWAEVVRQVALLREALPTT
jgi:argininosuccinate lyase